MSLGTFFEWLAGRKQPRFEAYRRARLTYEAYLARNAVDFNELTDDHFLAARADPSLAQAERDYRHTIQLSQKENAQRDAAIAFYQLGMLLHIQGRFEEARDPLCQALDILDSLPQVERDEQSAISNCHYHLGLIALRLGDAHEARSQLERSVRIDTSLGDLSGAAMGKRALARCPIADACRTGELATSSPPPHHAPKAKKTGTRSRQAPPPRRANPSQQPSGYGPRASVTAPAAWAYFPGEDIIWVLTYSAAANDRLLALMESLQGQFPRKTLVSCVAFGSPESAQSVPEPIAEDARLCAAVVVVEPEGLSDEAFRYWAKWCMMNVARRPDFRMYVCLEGMNLDEFAARANSDELVADLLDTVQIAQSPTLDGLHVALVCFLQSLDDIRSAAHWRRTRLFLSDFVGRAASMIQVTCGTVLAAASATSNVVLRHVSDPGPHKCRKQSQVEAVAQDSACGRWELPHQCAEKDSLTGSARPDQTYHLSPISAKGDLPNKWTPGRAGRHHAHTQALKAETTFLPTTKTA